MPIGFDKLLPRDNRMFYINEGNNLDVKEDSFLDKYAFLDILPKHTKLTSLMNA